MEHLKLRLTVLLVLVEPLVAVLHEQLVLAKAGIDKAVHKAGCQVLSGRVHLASSKRGSRVLQVRLVYILGDLGLHDVQLHTINML